MSRLNTLTGLGSWEDYQENYQKRKLYQLPDFPVPSRYERDYNSYLKVFAFEGAVKRYGAPLPAKVTERLESELLEIRKKGNEGFFLIISDMIQAAKKTGILVKYRGGFSGSLLFFVLNMSEIDPMKYNLSGLLGSYNDMIFFSEGGKAKMIEYLVKKYGTESIWLTSNYSGNAAGIEENHVVIASKKLKSTLPTLFSEKEQMEVCLIDGIMLGRLRVPMLMLFDDDELSEISFILSEIKQKQGVEIDLKGIPFNDSKIFEYIINEQFKSLFWDKNTESHKEPQLTNIEQLSILFSTNPSASIKKIPKYIALKNGTKPVKYVLPEMESILGETYGLIIYKEQLVLLAQKAANFSVNKSEVFYRNIRDTSLQKQFIEACVANGHSLNVCEKIVKKIEKEGGPIWSKSRAILRSLTAYQMTWLKVYYPEEFKEGTNNLNIK